MQPLAECVKQGIVLRKSLIQLQPVLKTLNFLNSTAVCVLVSKAVKIITRLLYPF